MKSGVLSHGSRPAAPFCADPVSVSNKFDNQRIHRRPLAAVSQIPVQPLNLRG
jgi:hypothetical protein